MERLAEFDQAAGLEIETESFTPVVGETKQQDPLLAGATDEDGLTALASSSYSAWYRTAWEDCCQIDVNTVTVYLNWTSNGSCVTASSNHTGEWAWFTATGWFLVSKSGSGGRTCNNAYTKATGSFGNWAWNDDNKYTWTKHTNTTIRGFASGAIGIANNMTKGGEDSSLLFKDFVCSWKNC